MRIDDDGLDQRERHGAGQCPMSRVQALGRLAEVGNASRRQRQVPVRMSAPDDATVGIGESGDWNDFLWPTLHLLLELIQALDSYVQ